ncbi:MAG: SAM-dependent chlorinase/fluorinase, partial [Oscillospiraceae bacterium]|nr:SAM-dependent chlorinase/fluorinase [Oscillospiraceae bacterium]
HMSEGTENQYTFCGRDLYAHVAAKLAAGKMTFEEVGDEVAVETLVKLNLGEVIIEEGSIKGHVDILDARFGSIWTNITREDFLSLNAKFGEYIEIVIRNSNMLIYSNRAIYGRSFADVNIGEQIVYVNSLLRMAVAINQGNFARAYSVGTGLQWTIEFKKIS